MPMAFFDKTTLNNIVFNYVNKIWRSTKTSSVLCALHAYVLLMPYWLGQCPILTCQTPVLMHLCTFNYHILPLLDVFHADSSRTD